MGFRRRDRDPTLAKDVHETAGTSGTLQPVKCFGVNPVSSKNLVNEMFEKNTYVLRRDLQEGFRSTVERTETTNFAVIQFR